MKVLKHVASLLMLISPAVYANCDPYTIIDISTRNVAIAITGGTVWEVFPLDRDKVYTWKPGDEVMMCYGHMINKVQEDQQVSVTYLGDYDTFYHGVPYPYKGWCCGFGLS